MANTILTAIVHPVPVGSTEIEGLLLENGEYAIAQQQVASLFSVMATSAPEWLERNLGKGFQLWKVTTNRPKQAGKQNRAENALSLIDFEKLLRKLDRKGNEIARVFVDNLVGLSLRQLFADAFGEKFEKEERQKLLQSRQAGKIQRLSLTDGIKAYMQANGIENGSKWYGGCTQNTYLALFGMTKAALLKARGVEDSKTTPRDYMSYEELESLARFENHAAILMIKKGMEPLTAVKETKEFFS